MWLLLLLTLLCTACAEAQPRVSPPAGAADEDLVALLPAGAEAIFDLDLAGLRAAPLGQPLFAELPGSLRRSAALFTAEPLRDLDALALGVTGLGTEQLEAVLVARGRIDAPGLRERFLVQEPRAALVHYHGQELLEPPAPVASGGQALGFVGAQAAVLGGRSAVRQVIDNQHGAGAGARSEPELLEALARAPRARVGRPALWFAVLPSAALRDRLRQADLAELGADATFLCGALAVADGVDVGLVAGFKELAVAKDVAQRLQERVAWLRRRPLLARLGLARHLQALVVQAAPPGGQRKVAEVHLAWRLDQADAAEVLTRLAELRRLLDAAPRR